MRGRAPKQQGQGPGLRNVRLGERGGREQHTLNTAEMPPHNHTASLHAEDATADKYGPNNKMLAVSASVAIYAKPTPSADHTLAPESIIINNSGGGQSFSIDSPYLGVNFIIALQGVYPPRS